MNNIFNYKLSYFKYICKNKQNSVHSFLVRHFTDTLFKCRSRNLNVVYDSEVKKNLLVKNTRSLSISVKNLNKENQGVCTEKTKNDNSIIYYGTLAVQVKSLKIFSCLTSIGGIAFQPFIVQSILNGKDVLLGSTLFSVVGFFSYVTPFIIHSFTKKYVTEIWYNSATNTYTATVFSFFLRRVNISFRIEDVEVPSFPSLFSTVKVKGKPLYIISESFLNVEHYIKMMRYDKPVDLKLDNKKL